MQIPFVISGIFLLLIVVISIIWIHCRGISPRLWILIAVFPKYRLYFTLVDCLNLLQQEGMCYTEWLGQYSHEFEVKESDGSDIANVKTFISKTLQDEDFIYSQFSKLNKKGVRKFITPLQLNMNFISQCKNDWDQRKAEKKATNLLEPLRNTLQPLIDGGYLTKYFELGDKINDEHRYHKGGYLMRVIAKLCTFKKNDGYATKLAPFWGYKSVSDLTTAAEESLDESKTKGNLDDIKNDMKELTNVYINKSEKKAKKKQ